MAVRGGEEIRSLDPEDIDVLMEVIAAKISGERVKELKEYLGIV